MARWWPGNEPTEERRRPGRTRLGLFFLAVVLVLGAAVVHEVRTSFFQAAIFTRIASSFDWFVDVGPSELIRFPAGGPHDHRLGYSGIPALIERLDERGFDLTHQARMTPALLRWIDWGGYPTYAEKGPTGLQVHDGTGALLLDRRFPLHTFSEFDSIPDLVWRTLVHIESQGILDEGNPFRNPAVEWDRLALGAATLALRELGVETQVPGGSTLATQLEKYRHSPGGFTASPREKVRQMLNASLRAYSDGRVTLDQRRDVVLAYLNSVPLAAQVGHGEVVGLGEGLWAWYGTPPARANILLSEPTDAAARVEYARIYRQTLSLLVAQRRPTFYLASTEGRRSLTGLTRVYLDVLRRDGVIPTWLADLARNLPPERVRSEAPIVRPRPSQPSEPALRSVRADLLGLTQAGGPYQLDRLDLAVVATVDSAWSAEAGALLAALGNRDLIAAEGFDGPSLLGRGDPSKVRYSVLLLERTDIGNVVRMDVDNLPGEMSLAAGSRLELGSTAKLRTLATYLQVIEELYLRLAPLDADSLQTAARASTDVLTSWVARHLLAHPGAELGAVLEASLDRTYSASPRERFRTGGAELVFSNFDTGFDHATLSVRESFRHSVNLPFIRLMRDLVAYEMSLLGTAELLSHDRDERRQDYLVRFAEHEGAEFVRRFHRKYRSRSGRDVFTALLGERTATSTHVAWAARAVAPDLPMEVFADLVRTHGRGPEISDEQLSALHARVDPTGMSLSDLGYLSRVHPLELWVAKERLDRPTASLQELQRSSRAVVLDVYGWLLRTTRQRAQDVRIHAMLEIEAFQEIHARWRQLGYPFEDLTPSLGTAIGSSGDRPLALAELAAVIQNGGVKLPVIRVEAVRIAEGTPFETRMQRSVARGERILGPEVARLLAEAMRDVVTNGTGRRAAGALADTEGRPLEIGGKTGTGDNRYTMHDARGRPVGSRALSRTATLVFTAGDRYSGVITAVVEGDAAAEHRFTSALASQLLTALGRRVSLPSTIETEAVALPPTDPTMPIPSLPLPNLARLTDDAPLWICLGPRLGTDAMCEPRPARQPESNAGRAEAAVIPSYRRRFGPA